jgi:hypothetical protein
VPCALAGGHGSVSATWVSWIGRSSTGTRTTGVDEVGRDFQARRRWARSAGGRFASGAVRSRGAGREEARPSGGDAVAVGDRWRRGEVFDGGTFTPPARPVVAPHRGSRFETKWVVVGSSTSTSTRRRTRKFGVDEVGRDFQARRRWARGEGGRLASGAVRPRGARREEARSSGEDAAAVG